MPVVRASTDVHVGHFLREAVEAMTKSFENVLEFRVELRGIKPPIWRRIQVPDSDSFWDLHSAIQDAMGWMGGRLHAFIVKDPKSGVEEWIGVPDPEFEQGMKAGWASRVSKYFIAPRSSAEYLYDFGDGWKHKVTFQKIVPREPDAVYPRCVAGKRACPPEDCGGAWGYRRLLSGDPDAHKGYAAFDPEDFDVADVIFEDPEERRRDLEEWFDL